MTVAAAYVTYFDQRYLARALVMMRSLRRNDPGARIFPLCLDPLSHEVVAALGDPHIVPIAHNEVLEFEPRLLNCFGRPRVAFYATHKPALPMYVLARWPELERVTHVDADAFFFDSPAPLFSEVEGASILVSPHRYHPEGNWESQYGRFNAGFISWRNDPTGLSCLADYLEECLDRVEPDTTSGRFMNQGYLSAWPERYPGVHVVQHPGANLAPWNVRAHRLANRRIEGADRVTVNDAPLIFFHFSRMFRDPDGCWRTDYLEFGEANLAVALLKIYQPYFRAVDRQFDDLKGAGVEPEQVAAPDGLDGFHYLT